MRIVNEFSIGSIKATVFLYEENYTIQLEDQFGSVSYKLGKTGNMNLDDLPSLLQIPKIENSIVQAFVSMRTGRDELASILNNDEDSLDEIII